MKRMLSNPILKDVIRIPVGPMKLVGDLSLPEDAKGLIIFAHGSSSSRLSPRNIYVSDILNYHHLATLLFDLLTEEEDSKIANRFNVDLLSSRVNQAIDWAVKNKMLTDVDIGLFGASTGAAAALKASVDNAEHIKAVVSRGGRVDMAYPVLDQVKAPTLLIVGQNDSGVREINEEAFLRLNCHKELAEVPHAGHLFEEPHALERVAELAVSWFDKYLGANNVSL